MEKRGRKGGSESDYQTCTFWEKFMLQIPLLHVLNKILKTIRVTTICDDTKISAYMYTSMHGYTLMIHNDVHY